MLRFAAFQMPALMLPLPMPLILRRCYATLSPFSLMPADYAMLAACLFRLCYADAALIFFDAVDYADAAPCRCYARTCLRYYAIYADTPY